MNYYLVGYMYSGKSTFGRRLAADRGMRFLDLDRAFEQRYHYTAIRALVDAGQEVIACGGGTPCHSGNMDFILAHGTAIYLQMTVDQLTDRALRSRNPRPAMRGLDRDAIHAKIAAQLKEREPFYQKAPIVLDGMCPVF